MTTAPEEGIAFGMDSTEATAHDQTAEAPAAPDTQARPLTAEEQFAAEVDATIQDPGNHSAPEADAPEADPEATEETPEAGEDAAPETPETTEDQPPKEDDEDIDPQSGRPRRFRLQANDPVEARAFELRKHNRDLSLEECLARAKAELAPESGDEPPADGLPATLEEANQRLAALRAERKKAFGEDYDFGKTAELDEQIEALRDHMTGLQARELRAQDAEKEKFMATVEQSKAQAVDLYPDVSNPESELVKRMEAIDADLRETNNPLYFDPNKPLKVAQMAANDLSIAPRSRAKAPAKPVTPTQQTTRPRPTAPVVPASGNARTTTNQPNKPGELAAEVERVNDPVSYEKLIAAL